MRPAGYHSHALRYPRAGTGGRLRLLPSQSAGCRPGLSHLMSGSRPSVLMLRDEGSSRQRGGETCARRLSVPPAPDPPAGRIRADALTDLGELETNATSARQTRVRSPASNSRASATTAAGLASRGRRRRRGARCDTAARRVSRPRGLAADAVVRGSGRSASASRAACSRWISSRALRIRSSICPVSSAIVITGEASATQNGPWRGRDRGSSPNQPARPQTQDGLPRGPPRNSPNAGRPPRPASRARCLCKRAHRCQRDDAAVKLGVGESHPARRRWPAPTRTIQMSPLRWFSGTGGDVRSDGPALGEPKPRLVAKTLVR